MKQHEKKEFEGGNDYLDQAIQSYLRDACRILNLKIYQVELFYDGIDEMKSLRKTGHFNNAVSSALTSPSVNNIEQAREQLEMHA